MGQVVNKSFAVVFDTEFTSEEIADMMNDAATAAHKIDSTHPETYFVVTDTGVKLSRASTQSALGFTNVDKLYIAGMDATRKRGGGEGEDKQRSHA